MHLKTEWLKRAEAHPFEYEMRKRVFWMLYMMERTMALEMDRSFCMPEEDYDVSHLLELDDAALDLLQQGQKNPTGFSHAVAAYNIRVRLLQFASKKRYEMWALRHVSAHNDLHAREVNYLSGIPYRLQTLKGNIHKDLTYKPDQQNNERFYSTSLIHVQYYWVQLMLYRPFFSKSKRTSHSDIPILEMATTASHEIAGAIDKLRARRMIRGRIHEVTLAGFLAGSVLLMNMWEHKNADGAEDVYMCLEALKALEDRWQFPGMLYDVLKNFADVMTKVLSGHCPTTAWTPSTTGLVTPEDPKGTGTTNGILGHKDSDVISAAPIIAPPNGVVTASTSLNTAGEYPTFFLGTQDPFTQPFSVGQTGSLLNENVDGTMPMAPPPNQPMFGEDGWLNDLNFGGHGFMDPQFNEWLNSMLLATQETFPAEPLAATGTASQPIFSTGGVATTGTAGDSTWTTSMPWPFDQAPN